MSDEATAVETAAPAAAPTQVAFSPDASTEAQSFAALKASRNDAIAAAKAEARSAEDSAAGEQTEDASTEAPVKPQQSMADKLKGKTEAPAAAKTKPPSNLNGARKAFFDRQNAEKAAEESARVAQTTEQKMAEMSAKLEEQSAFQGRYRSLMSEGKFDEALRLSGVEGLDSVEALQRRVLEQEGLIKVTPKDDPTTRELKDQLAELKAWRDERVEAEKQASVQARDEAANRELFAAVIENNANHEDPAVQSWAKVPGFNQQVFAAMKAHPNATESQIYTQVLSGFTQLADALVTAGIVVRPGAPAARIPAQASAKPEAQSMGSPDRKKVASISTQSAEPATPGPWDPSQDAQAWQQLRRARSR